MLSNNLPKLIVFICLILPRECFVNARCPVSRFSCATTQKCLELKYVCDGKDHCGDGSDEKACKENGRIKKSVDSGPDSKPVIGTKLNELVDQVRSYHETSNSINGKFGPINDGMMFQWAVGNDSVGIHKTDIDGNDLANSEYMIDDVKSEIPDIFDFVGKHNNPKAKRGQPLTTVEPLVADNLDTGCPSGTIRCPKLGCAVDNATCEAYRECDWSSQGWKCIKQCGPNEYRCTSAYCFDEDKICNKVNDCSNGIDEDNCPNRLDLFKRQKNVKEIAIMPFKTTVPAWTEPEEISDSDYHDEDDENSDNDDQVIPSSITHKVAVNRVDLPEEAATTDPVPTTEKVILSNRALNSKSEDQMNHTSSPEREIDHVNWTLTTKKEDSTSQSSVNLVEVDSTNDNDAKEEIKPQNVSRVVTRSVSLKEQKANESSDLVPIPYLLIKLEITPNVRYGKPQSNMSVSIV